MSEGGSSLKAVILAAGIGSRLEVITRSKPKCMITVAGRPILDHQVRAYAAAGIKDIVIVAGYRSEQVISYARSFRGARVRVVTNVDYETTNNMYSLHLARDVITGGGFILSNGDVVFDPSIVRDILRNPCDDLIAADRGTYNDEAMKIVVDSSERVLDISKATPREQAYGNSIDVYRFSSSSGTALLEYVRHFVEVEGRRREWTELAIASLLRGGALHMRAFDIQSRPWVEIDTLPDLAQADRIFSRLLPHIAKKRIWFLDLDGTVYLGSQVISGVPDWIRRLEAMGARCYFLSNNSSRSKHEYVSKLGRMGIGTSADRIILSTDGVVEYLTETGVRSVYVLGTESLRRSLEEAGVATDGPEPECVVLGYDTELTYEKLSKAALHLNKGTHLVATHCDVVCPSPEGPLPDAGSLLALLEKATGKTPERIFGKPNPEMLAHVIRRLQVSIDDVVVVGDRLYTDFALAQRLGCDFVLVLSGDTGREHLENLDAQPALIVDKLSEIPL